MGDSPRDRFITVYGRIAVMEALDDDRLTVDKVLVARNAHGDTVDTILDRAKTRGVRVERTTPERVTRISRNGRHDQGVVADVVAPGLGELDDWLMDHPAPSPAALVVLDGVTNPSNVGMIIRAATAAGVAGTVLPRTGVPEVGPLVVKASAGTAFRATVLRSGSARDAVIALQAAGFDVVGLRGAGAESLYAADLPERLAIVVGNESDGIAPDTAALVSRWVAVPMAAGVESLNVAIATAVVVYELARRRGAKPDEPQT